MILEEATTFTPENRNKLAGFYQNHVLKQCLQNWYERTGDFEYGGYVTDFDRQWNVKAYDKGAWGQSRQIYLFSSVYESQDKDEKWLELAKCGKEFILKKMYVGEGRFNYLVNRDGSRVLEGPVSIFSDAFAVSGLAKYVSVTKRLDDLKILREIYSYFEKNCMNEAFTDTDPYKYEKNVCHHAIYMIALNTASECSAVLGNRVHALMKFCLDKIFSVLYDEQTGLIFEKKMNDGSRYQGVNAAFVNVGHTFESLWFCMEAALVFSDKNLQEKIIFTAENTYKRLMHTEDGLLFSFSADNEEQHFSAWKYEVNFKPDDKVCWTYAETMYLWVLLASVTGNQEYFRRFIKLHNVTQKYFIDREYGDWFHALNKNNKVIQDFKGSTVKSAYHIPRALIRILRVLKV